MTWILFIAFGDDGYISHSCVVVSRDVTVVYVMFAVCLYLGIDLGA